jgi:hypothetical protein
MVRQCAWCLRLINEVGERTSVFPIPKIYEATHGICKICGTSWLEAMRRPGDDGEAVIITQSEDGRHHIQCIGEGKFPVIASAPLPENETQLLAEATILASDRSTGGVKVFTRKDELCLV